MPISYISHTKINPGEEVQGEDIRVGIFSLIQQKYPGFTTKHYISIDELNLYRRLHLTSPAFQQKGTVIDEEVVTAFKNNAILSENIHDEVVSKLTVGQKLADKIAVFGGSWTFIIAFFVFILLWIGINIWLLSSKAFDPFPFILLNLILSCLAAIQAPIIMMSQNRQEQKDRQRAEHDYQINLKAELEIQFLSEKIDQVLILQNKKLLELQEQQMDYLKELTEGLKKAK